jgi:hypothetical protein
MSFKLRIHGHFVHIITKEVRTLKEWDQYSWERYGHAWANGDELLPAVKNGRGKWIWDVELEAELLKKYDRLQKSKALAKAGTPISVPIEQKDDAKKLGAKWDGFSKTWYIPAHITDHSAFQQWMS